MSLITLLSIARSALLMQQRAMGVTAHNVANAQTPGYSRQRLDLVPEDPLRESFGMVGRGVTATGVTRARDTMLDFALRADSGSLGHANTRLDLMSGVEGALLEPSDQGVASALDGLLQSFADLSNDPSSGAQRELVRSAGQHFVNEVHRINDALDSAEQQGRTRLQDQVGEVNRLAGEVAQLNAQIVSTHGGDAPDLLDRRDQLLDQLSGYGGINVQTRPDGSQTVVMGEHVLVEGANSHDLEVQAIAGGGWGVGAAGIPGVLNTGTGSLSALSELLTTTLPGMHAQLDQYVQAAAGEINAQHSAGFNLAGATGVDFFDMPTTSASSLAMDGAIVASTDAIAAGGSPARGDGNNALALAALGGKNIALLGGRTMGQFYEQFSTGIGVAAQDADRDVSVQQALVGRDDARRQSVSGVSVDEEMVNLIGQQTAYSAAARIVKVADELMQDVLNMMG